MKSTNTDNISQKVSSILVDIGAISFRPKKPFRYDSGILSPVYTDNRLVISYPNEWKKITKYLIDKVSKIGIPDVIAGTATAGIPHAAIIASELKIPMVYVRSEPKGHGKGNQVEGVIKKGQKAIVIEDLISTGGSSVRVIHALRAIGAKVSDEIAIFTYEFKSSEVNFKKNKVKLHPLTNLVTTTKVAAEKGFLNSDQIDIVLNWVKDPKNWAKKMNLE